MQQTIGESFPLTSTYTGTFQTVWDPLMAQKHAVNQPPQGSFTSKTTFSIVLVVMDDKHCFSVVVSRAPSLFRHLSMTLSYSLKMACFQEHNMWDLSPMSLWQKKPFPLCRELRGPFPGVRLSTEQSLHLPVVQHKDNCEHLWKYGTLKPLVPVLYSKVIVLNPEKVDSCVKMTLVRYN